jgi:hypothetical protein
MRFEEAYAGWQAVRLRQDAARLLGVCERSFRRYIDRLPGLASTTSAGNGHRYGA